MEVWILDAIFFVILPFIVFLYFYILKLNNKLIGPIMTTDLINKAGGNIEAQKYLAELIRKGIKIRMISKVERELERIKATENVKRFLESHS